MTMENNKKYGVIAPRNDLQKLIGGPLKPLDERHIANLQAAMESFASGMDDWIRTDLERLVRARNSFLQHNQSADHIDKLRLAAHDLKGLGTTYGFPLVSIIADALCKAIEMSLEKGALPEDLVNAHVDALRAVVNLNMRDHENGPAAELLRGLSKLVEIKIA